MYIINYNIMYTGNICNITLYIILYIRIVRGYDQIKYKLNQKGQRNKSQYFTRSKNIPCKVKVGKTLDTFLVCDL